MRRAAVEGEDSWMSDDPKPSGHKPKVVPRPEAEESPTGFVDWLLKVDPDLPRDPRSDPQPGDILRDPFETLPRKVLKREAGQVLLEIGANNRSWLKLATWQKWAAAGGIGYSEGSRSGKVKIAGGDGNNSVALRQEGV